MSPVLQRPRSRATGPRRALRSASRFTARSGHETDPAQSQAPRPGAVRLTRMPRSGAHANRTSSDCGARRPQPTHVRNRPAAPYQASPAGSSSLAAASSPPLVLGLAGGSIPPAPPRRPRPGSGPGQPRWPPLRPTPPRLLPRWRRRPPRRWRRSARPRPPPFPTLPGVGVARGPLLGADHGAVGRVPLQLARLRVGHPLALGVLDALLALVALVGAVDAGVLLGLLGLALDLDRASRSGERPGGRSRPSRPMARESWKSGTMTSATPVSSWMLDLLDLGRRERLGHEVGLVLAEGDDVDLLAPQLGDHHADPRARAPTHAPTGSTLWSLDQTAIFVRWPGSWAQALISTTPSPISGTSSSNRRLIRPGWVRDTTIWGPLGVRRTSTMYAFSRAPASGRSKGTCSAWAAAPRPCPGRAGCSGCRAAGRCP